MPNSQKLVFSAPAILLDEKREQGKFSICFGIGTNWHEGEESLMAKTAARAKFHLEKFFAVGFNLTDVTSYLEGDYFRNIDAMNPLQSRPISSFDG